MSDFENNLIVLVADKDIHFLMQGLLTRHLSLGIIDLSASLENIFVHPQRDPGCYNQCSEFLRPFTKDYKNALVIFDHDGSGQEDKSREEIENDLEQKLSASGWNDRAKVIVLEPEIEAWVWSDSPHVDKILGWENNSPNLREWLKEIHFLAENELKPKRPKEAVEAVLREVRKPRSSAIYQQIAEKVSFKNCTDESFIKLRNTLQEWFKEYVNPF
jgi:hypothetical protein